MDVLEPQVIENHMYFLGDLMCIKVVNSLYIDLLGASTTKQTINAHLGSRAMLVHHFLAEKWDDNHVFCFTKNKQFAA